MTTVNDYIRVSRLNGREGTRPQASTSMAARSGGGKVTRLVICVDREHALADLVLAPEGGADGPD